MCAPADPARPALHAALRRPPCARASCISYLSRPCLRPVLGRPPGLWRLHWRRRRSQRPPVARRACAGGRAPTLRQPRSRDDDDHGRDSGRVRDDGHDDNNGNRHNRGDAAPGVDGSTCGDDCAVVGRDVAAASSTTVRPGYHRATAGPARGDGAEARERQRRRRERNGDASRQRHADAVGRSVRLPRARSASFSDTWGAARADVGWHHGVDIFARLGSPVVAVADGVLFSVGWNTSAAGGSGSATGRATSSTTRTSHASPDRGRRREFRAGTVIAYVGNTGDAAGTPYHLHFEIHPASLLSLGYDGAVDPFRTSRHGRGSRARPVLRSAVAGPPPGAILIGYTDISSAEGLDPDAAEQTLRKPVRRKPPLAAPRPGVGRTARAPARSPADARWRGSSTPRPASCRSEPVWDSLSRCESGGNWNANTGNGYVGGLQFLPQTWIAHGGGEFAPSANLATRNEQIAVADRVLASQGWGAWPACSAMLGLGATPGPR